jgi:hypothetical protein
MEITKKVSEETLAGDTSNSGANDYQCREI